MLVLALAAKLGWVKIELLKFVVQRLMEDASSQGSDGGAMSVGVTEHGDRNAKNRYQELH
jgi:hypothetical protein